MTALRHFLIALQFFTRIPVTGRLAQWVGFSPEMLRASAAYFPVVGVVVGGIVTLLTAALLFLLPSAYAPLVAAVLGTAAGVWITGAFHDLKDTLSDKNRLRTLFEARTNSALQNSPTINHLKDFLRACQVDDYSSYWENFYKVRNIVFHAWWSIPEGARQSFSLLVAGVENDIAEVVISYTPIS
jgi:hypothetical protein